MSSKKFKTYCRIMDYVDAVDPELSELLRGTCADLALGSLKGKPGITFLMPQDKAYRKKISDLAYSPKVEEATKASDMLTALIIRDVFKSPSDWLAKKDDIPNSLFPSQHIEIESASGKEVVFKSGAKAVLDTDFQDASRKSNLAVWKLVSGEIPVTSDKPAKMKYIRKQKGKAGSYEVTSLVSQSERFKIAIAVENSYVLQELSRRINHAPIECVYLKHTLSLIHYIMHTRQDTNLLYDKVLPMISLDKLDFYLLVEPHRNTTQHLLDDMLIHEWWLNKNMNFKLIDMVNDIEHLLTGANSNALVYSNRIQLIEKIADVRKKLSQKIDARPRDCITEIENEYKELESTNTICGLGPVYPPGLAQFYASEPGLKMLHDELRYLTFGAFRRLESSPQFDMGSFNRLINMIGDYLHAATADERSKVLQLLNKNIRYQIMPTEKVQEIKIFVNSTMFMYIPLTRSEAKNIQYKYSVTRPDPRNIMLFNISENIYAGHRRLLMDQSGNMSTDVATVLASLDVNNLDPALKNMLLSKLGISPSNK